jgi:hypothetical protein
MNKNESKKKKKIEPFDKSDWKKLDEVEKFENDISGKWIQKGPYIINTSQKLDYGVYIGNDKKLVGVDENGKPIIK